MFKNHPKGLIIASIANMGERFGFYTMMAILFLFLQSKFGLDEVGAGTIYSTFYFFIYVLALVGGIIADNFLGLTKTIFIGIVLMFGGYLVISLPQSIIPTDMAYYVVIAGLGLISLGNGLFKGNLQALVGNLYNDPRYSSLRDRAFSIFYMCINVGAIFAPFAATGIRNWWLTSHNLAYNSSLPKLCHEHLAGTLQDSSTFQTLADSVSSAPVTDLTAFASQYLNIFNTGYHFAFAIAAGSMLISMLVYMIFKKELKPGAVAQHHAQTEEKKEGKGAKVAITADEKKRLIALGLVFLIVIFFWMSFHQNGVTLTSFAKDYTNLQVGPATALLFNIVSLMGIMGAIGGLLLLISAKGAKNKSIGALLLTVGAGIIYKYYTDFAAAGTTQVAPELFQSFNPLFVVGLTPVVVGFFGWLNSRGKEPSAPRKIGIGMLIAAFSFGIMMVGSFGLIAPKSLVAGAIAPEQASAYLLIGTYLSLTFAELFLSPMGISFVSKVAPPRFAGLMQGGWLCATALGNQLLFVGTVLWKQIEIWQVWAFFITCCLISAIIIFTLMKRLEAVAK